jgi:nucleoside-diphosphate-sugar epimerase
MKILVVGGSGFIGSRLITALLDAGHQVHIFDKAPSALHPQRVTLGDVRDRDAVTRAAAGCDCIVNLAAEHTDDVRPASLYFDVNVGGARTVVHAAEQHAVDRLVFISSVAVYGLDRPQADESAALQPSDDYGRSKVDAEAVYAQWANAQPGRALTVLRSTVVFGPGNRGNVHQLIEHILRRRFVMVGRGDNRKSIAYVDNLVDFMLTRLDAGAGVHLFNYADKPDLSTAELVRMIRALLPGTRGAAFRLPYLLAIAAGYAFDAAARLLRRPTAISAVRVRKFCAETTVATGALQRSGFRARHTIEEGLARTIDAMGAGGEARGRGTGGSEREA